MVTFVCFVYHLRAITAGPRGTLDYRSATRIYPRSIDLETSDGEHSASFGAANP